MAAGMFWSVTYSLQQTDSFFLLSRQHHRTAAWVAGLLWRCAACEARRRWCMFLAPLKCRPCIADLRCCCHGVWLER